jgi:hypothetical protein
VHQWLGVSPDLGEGRLNVVPQVPAGQTSVAAQRIRLGGGFVDVSATHNASTYTTTLTASRAVGATKLVIGHTLPRGTTPKTVKLDGRTVNNYTVRTTNRGAEVTVPTSTGTHTLEVLG